MKPLATSTSATALPLVAVAMRIIGCPEQPSAIIQIGKVNKTRRTHFAPATKTSIPAFGGFHVGRHPSSSAHEAHAWQNPDCKNTRLERCTDQTPGHTEGSWL
jgi:hypothetical protein